MKKLRRARCGWSRVWGICSITRRPSKSSTRSKLLSAVQRRSAVRRVRSNRPNLRSRSRGAVSRGRVRPPLWFGFKPREPHGELYRYPLEFKRHPCGHARSGFRVDHFNTPNLGQLGHRVQPASSSKRQTGYTELQRGCYIFKGGAEVQTSRELHEAVMDGPLKRAGMACRASPL